MGSYSYKEVARLIPNRIADQYDDFNDAGYDGGLHDAASDYILELLEEIKELKKQLASCTEKEECSGCKMGPGCPDHG
jgi:hypothetical protein